MATRARASHRAAARRTGERAGERAGERIVRAGAPDAPESPVKRWTLERQAEFLAHLAVSCNVRASARAVGMSEQGVHRLRLRSPEFRAAWATALEEGYVRLELMLLERAIKAIAGPQGKDGPAAGPAREPSDRLGLALLNGARRAPQRASPAETPRDRAEIRRRIDAKLAEMNRRMGGEE